MAKLIVLDTNILVRAVLGHKVSSLLEKYVDNCQFFTPDNCYQELECQLPRILEKRKVQSDESSQTIDALGKIVIPIPEEDYIEYKDKAQRRIKARDPKDWEVVALAMQFDCPIWTEDKDFFGIGIATWNSQNVEIYLNVIEK